MDLLLEHFMADWIERSTMPRRPGKRIKLITDLPMQQSDADLLSQQDSCCAGCRAPLTPPEPVKKGFLRSIASSRPKQAKTS